METLSPQGDLEEIAVNRRDALNRPLFSQFVALAVPTVLSGWVYTAYTLIDGIFIGRYVGQQALAALNLIVPVLYVPYAISLMLGVGGATLIARLLGEEREAEARRAFTQVLWAILVISAVLSVAILLFKGEIVALLGARGSLAVDAQAYLAGWGWFVLFANALYALELFLRVESTGAARFGLYAMLIGALTNAALNYWLIVVRGMGVQGAALATGVSAGLSSIAMFAYHVFYAKRVIPAWVPVSGRGTFHVGRIMYNGVSEFLDALAPVITVFAFNRIVLAYYGETGLVAYALLEYMTLGAAVTMVSLVQSMQPMISYHRGAGNVGALHGSLRLGAISVMSFAVLVAIGTVTLSLPLASLFLPADADAALAILKSAVPWYALALIPAAVNLIVAGFLTAIEEPGSSALIAALRSWVVLLGTLWLLNAWFGGTAVWYALLITELLTLMASGWLCWRVLRGNRRLAVSRQ